MKIMKDIVYGTQDPENQVLDVYLPENEEADLLIYFHGGGLEEGDKVHPLVDHLFERGKAIISANYRMYPNAVFPEFLEDAAMVINWAKENLGKYKTMNKLFVGGSSAGAWITAMLAFDPHYLEKYNIKTTDITGYIIDSAQMTTHYNILRERGIDTKRILVDTAAPVYFIHEETVFPNIYIFVSDNDIPCRLEQNLMFMKTLERFGCPAEKITYQMMNGYGHCGYVETDVFADMLCEYMNTTDSSR